MRSSIRWNSNLATPKKVIRLPGGFTGFSPPADAPDPNALPALATGTITLGSAHALGKVNRQMIRLWASALHEIPNSRLLIVRHTLTGSARWLDCAAGWSKSNHRPIAF